MRKTPIHAEQFRRRVETHTDFVRRANYPKVPAPVIMNGLSLIIDAYYGGPLAVCYRKNDLRNKSSGA